MTREPYGSTRFYCDDSCSTPGQLLRWRARIYLRQIVKRVNIDQNANILEIGCNRGYLTELLKRMSATVTGVDINPSIISKSHNSNLKVMDACDLKFRDGCFELIVSTHTIEHVHDTSSFFGESSRVLKKGGNIVLIYPWEPVRGYTVLPEVLSAKRPLKDCRKIHLHAFTPIKIKAKLNSSLVQKTWGIFFVPQPNFISVISKIG